MQVQSLRVTPASGLADPADRKLTEAHNLAAELAQALERDGRLVLAAGAWRVVDLIDEAWQLEEAQTAAAAA